MKNSVINDHTALVLRISELKAEKIIQEGKLKNSFKEFTNNFSPLSLLKGSMQELADDKEAQSVLLKAGLNLGSNFIIEKVLGRSRSIKGFLSSILVEKLSTPFINNKVSKIISGISKLGHRNPGPGTNPQ